MHVSEGLPASCVLPFVRRISQPQGPVSTVSAIEVSAEAPDPAVQQTLRVRPELNTRPRESVADYPRPPAVERVDRHIRVLFSGHVIADTRRAVRYYTHPSPGYEALANHVAFYAWGAR